MGDIVYSPRVFNEKVKTVHYDNPVTVRQVLEDLGATDRNLSVFINGAFPQSVGLDHVIKQSDFIQVYATAEGGNSDEAKLFRTVLTIGVIIASQGIASGAIGGLTGVTAAVAGVAVAIGGTFLINRLFSPGLPAGGASTAGAQRQQVTPFSLSASGNQARPYEPLPLVMGRHRIFPDFSAQPYTRFQWDQTTFVNNEFFRWRQTGTDPATRTTDPGVQNVTVNIDGTNYTCVFESGTGTAATPPLPTARRWVTQFDFSRDYWNSQEEALANSPDVTAAVTQREARPLYVFVPSGAPASVALRWCRWDYLEYYGSNIPSFWTDPGSGGAGNGYAFFPRTYLYELASGSTVNYNQEQVLYEILNYGFGDLEILDTRVGQTLFSNIRDAQVFNVIKSTTDWTIPTDGADTIAPDGINSDYEYNTVEGDVNTVAGGELVNSDAFTYANNFIIRRSPTRTFGIEVDIEGRIFGQDNVNPPGGAKELIRFIDVEYRQVNPTGPWQGFTLNSQLPQPLAGIGATPYEIQAVGFDKAYRVTFVADNLTPGEYEARVAKVSPDETQPNEVCTLNCTQIKFFQQDLGINNYVGQNRRGYQMHSSTQLNGRLDKVSSRCDARTYRLDTETWGESTNPANWFLYFARGGFKNTSANGSLTWPFSPTTGWMNNADHPDNGERLFGAGISDSKIDFDSLRAWRDFCATNDLRFNAVLDDKQNCFETLIRIAAVGRATPTWSCGKLGVIFEDANDPAVAMFGMNNIIRDSFSISYVAEKTADVIAVQYTDARFDWEQREVRATVPGVTNPIDVATVNFWGISGTDGAQAEEQAQREANLLAAAQLYNRRTITWETDIEGLIVKRGDVVLLSHDVTQWSWSGRICSGTIGGENLVLTFETPCPINQDATTFTVRLPDNTTQTFTGTVNGNIVTLTSPWSATDFAYYIDDDKTINTTSQWEDSVPEDFMFFADVTATPGKRVRVTGVSMVDENRFKISAIDEELAYYNYEYNGLPDPIAAPDPDDYTRLEAKVFNIGVKDLGEGKARIYWESDGNIAATAFVSVNGSGAIPYIGSNGATIFGTELEVEYTSGDTVTISVTPVAIGAPYLLTSDEITFTLE